MILFKIAPIKKNRVVFMSYNGKYTDSPLYLSELMAYTNPEFEQVWIVNEREKKNLPAHIKSFKKGSLCEYFVLGSANIIIDNVYCEKKYTRYAKDKMGGLMIRLHKFLMTKNKQFAYTTFHGLPLKKMGRDRVGSDVIDLICPNTTFLLDNDHSCKVFNRLTFGNISIYKIGSPRIEKLLIAASPKIQELKVKLHIPNKKKVLVYAPTFRNNSLSSSNGDVYRSGIQQLEEFNIDKLLDAFSQSLGDSWVLVLRFHRAVSQKVDWTKIESRHGDIVINGNISDDMNDYLTVCDALITDYSSCMFECSAIYKPCFLYVNDYENYLNSERGLYFDIEELPFPRATNFADLQKAIRDFSRGDYNEKIKAFHDRIGLVIDRNASLNIINYIAAHNK